MSIDLSDTSSLALRGGAAARHESAEDWYAAYGRHLSTERAGDVEIQAIDYDWLDEDDDAEVLTQHRDDLPSDMSDGECRELIALARGVQEAAEEIVGLLEEAVEAYDDDDLDGVCEALLAASRAEGEHGDDPATRELVTQLLIERHKED